MGNIFIIARHSYRVRCCGPWRQIDRRASSYCIAQESRCSF